ncbi:hypothetical protein CDAR_227201 [Caerostris darwini]|uniref:Uncharacterized protein n=1 Tax=Caerostris darwini TaxID=1538125 RepID=A0AAV4PED1_9ARAC|nr:hypothetical protein CDAR_227201 [Caerostris darwini]
MDERSSMADEFQCRHIPFYPSRKEEKRSLELTFIPFLSFGIKRKDINILHTHEGVDMREDSVDSEFRAGMRILLETMPLSLDGAPVYHLFAGISDCPAAKSSYFIIRSQEIKVARRLIWFAV